MLVGYHVVAMPLIFLLKDTWFCLDFYLSLIVSRVNINFSMSFLVIPFALQVVDRDNLEPWNLKGGLLEPFGKYFFALMKQAELSICSINSSEDKLSETSRGILRP